MISLLGTARWTTAEATDSGRARQGQGQVELVPAAACLDSVVRLVRCPRLTNNGCHGHAAHAHDSRAENHGA